MRIGFILNGIYTKYNFSDLDEGWDCLAELVETENCEIILVTDLCGLPIKNWEEHIYQE